VEEDKKFEIKENSQTRYVIGSAEDFKAICLKLSYSIDDEVLTQFLTSLNSSVIGSWPGPRFIKTWILVSEDLEVDS
jgi:hypothetical protein